MHLPRMPQLAFILYLVAFIFSSACQEPRIPRGSATSDQNPGLPDGLPASSSNLLIENPKKDLAIRKRRPRTHRPGAKPTTTADTVHTVHIFKMETTYTNEEWKWMGYLLRSIPQLITVMLVGVELEPRNQIRVQFGAFNLNLYAMLETLTQSIVLAVMNKLLEMMTRGFAPFGLGEVIVGAGVRVLFAAGIQLQGFEDIYEIVEAIRMNWRMNT